MALWRRAAGPLIRALFAFQSPVPLPQPCCLMSGLLSASGIAESVGAQVADPDVHRDSGGGLRNPQGGTEMRAEVVTHAQYVAFQVAEVAVPRRLSRATGAAQRNAALQSGILERIRRLAPLRSSFATQHEQATGTGSRDDCRTPRNFGDSPEATETVCSRLVRGPGWRAFHAGPRRRDRKKPTLAFEGSPHRPFEIG